MASAKKSPAKRVVKDRTADPWSSATSEERRSKKVTLTMSDEILAGLERLEPALADKIAALPRSGPQAKAPAGRSAVVAVLVSDAVARLLK